MESDDTCREESHPSASDLQAFGLGLLTLTDFESIAEHLDRCPQCEQLVTNIHSDDFVRLLKRAAQSADPGPLVSHRVALGYEILQELGRGGMGVVFLARQPGLGRLVALKQLRSGTLASPHEIKRFRREAEALARLDHPNIVRVYESGEQENIPFLALEYVPGITLAQRLKTGPIDLHEGVELLLAVARAVAYSHSEGIIHRDLKPGNILLQRDPKHPDGPGIPRITDFGLARPTDLSSDTVSGTLIGTPAYMAPEQIDGTIEEVGPTADLFSVGAILYEFLTGAPPFRGRSTIETLDLVRNMAPVPPARITPSIPRRLEEICLRCLEKRPSSRYRSANELADDLERFLRNESVTEVVAPPIGSISRMWQEHFWVAWGLMAILIVGALGLWYGQNWRHPPDHRAWTLTVSELHNVPGLTLWLRADRGIELDSKGHIRHWHDQSGPKAHHAAQLIAEHRPQLVETGGASFPVVQFDGENDFLDLAGQFLESQTFTIVAAANYQIGDVGSHILLSNWDSGKTRNSVFLGVMDSEGVFPRFTDEIGGMTDENIQLTRRALIPQPGQMFLITARSSATNSEVYINSTRLLSMERPLAKRDLSGVWRIGTQGGGWEFWKGSLAELASYDRALDDRELQQVWDTLRRRYFSNRIP
ncbi:protein kinase domain-containing protein [Schlesneria sp.]|uniref:serine/threonine-protein kinase n=1 Tax=Schlesneria sp. TaxID=2762018 RepID=UPI002EF9F743